MARGMALALLLPVLTTVGASPHQTSPTRTANASTPVCRVVAFLHVPKCAGSSVRYLFKKGSGSKWRCPNICTQLSMVCKAWGCQQPDQPLTAAHIERFRKRGLPPLDAHTEPLWFFERHCGPNLERFARWLPRLRRFVQSRGCHFAALTMLRDPVSMLMSDFFFFDDYTERTNLTLSKFAPLYPEMLLLDQDAHLDVESSVPALVRARRGEYPTSLGAQTVRRLEAARRAAADAQIAYVNFLPGFTEDLRRDAMRRAAWLARSARLKQATLAARAHWLLALRSSGILTCARLIAAVEPLLAHFDVVGVVDRFAESVLLTTDTLGMDEAPALRFTNRMHGGKGARASHAPRPNAIELESLLPQLRSLNNCSTQLVDRARERIDARVARRGEAFQVRLERAKVAWAPPKAVKRSLRAGPADVVRS